MNEKGVTLIELLMVTAIIGILLATIFMGYRGENKELILQRVASKMVTDMERTREMAMSAQSNEGNYSGGGYGIYLSDNSEDLKKQYTIFADTNSDQERSASEDIDTIYMEDNILITRLIPSNQLDIMFVPPSPTVYIEGVEGSAIIRIAIDTDSSKFKEIVISNTGLIYAR